MFHLRAACAVLASLAISAGLLTGLSGAPATATPVEAVQAPRLEKRGPGFQQPKVGKCYLMSQKQAFAKSSTKRPVPCSGQHKTKTIRVFRLPKRVGWKNERRISVIVSKRCWPAWDEVLGGTKSQRMLTAYNWVFFRPTLRQRNRGARWIRCDLVLPTKQGLLGLKADPTVSSKLFRDQRGCFARGYEFVYSCKSGYRWKSAKAVQIASKRYPTRKQFERKARRACRSVGPDWQALITGPYHWRAGTRVITCFEPR